MNTVTKRELNQNTASVLDWVTDADDLVVTERGIPRWRVSMVRGQDAPLARLEREGRYTPPAVAPMLWPSHPGGPAYTDEQVDWAALRFPDHVYVCRVGLDLRHWSSASDGVW